MGSTTKIIQLILLVTVASEHLFGGLAHAQTSEKKRVQRKIISDKSRATEVNHAINFSIDGGYITSSPSDSNIETDKSGNTLNLGLSWSIFTETAIFDLGLEWWKTELKPKDSDISDITVGETVVTAINTRLGTADASVLFGNRFLAVGPTAKLLFGIDSGFGPEVEQQHIPNVLIGGTLRLYLKEPTPKETFTSSIDVSALTDITIDERQITALTLGINFGFGLTSKERKIVEQITKVKTRVRTRTRTKKVYVPKVVAERQFYIDAGFVNFETAKHNLRQNESQYIAAVGRLLKKNRAHWDKVIIRSHTDVRGSVEFNRGLSKRRANAVKQIFLGTRLTAQDISITSKMFSEPVVDSRADKALAKNRRVELLIRGDDKMDELKSKIIILQQQYRLPGTCGRRGCK